MKFLLTIALSAVCLLHLAKAQTNYCATNLCPAGVKHIACQHNGKFAATCPTNANMVDLTSSVSLILQMHNVRRNTLALGNLPGFQPAKKMATMQWNNELAKIAAFNVKQCTMKHDACRNTPTFSKSGQNLAYISYTGDKNSMTNRAIIIRLINLWWDEYKFANMNVINSYPASWSGSPVGHFTAMAADRNIRVGCAAARYTRNTQHNFLLACNYATTNIISQPIYVAGTTASSCTRGKNPTYPGLCAAAEPYSGL